MPAFGDATALLKCIDWGGMRKREVDYQSILEYTDSFQGPQWCGWKQLTSNLKIVNILRGVQRSDVANLQGVVGGNTPGDMASSLVRQTGPLVAGVTNLPCSGSLCIRNRVRLHQLQ